MPKTVSWEDATKAAPKTVAWEDVAPKDETTGFDAALEESRKREQGRGAPLSFAGPMSFGLDDPLNALTVAGGTALRNVVNAATGRKSKFNPADAFKAEMQAQKETRERFSKQHPALAAGAGVAGAFATPGIGLVDPALESIGVVNPLAKALAAGGAIGGASAAGQSKGPIKDRLKATGEGVLGGLATGGLLHGGSKATGALGRLLGPGAKELAARLKEHATGVRPGEVTPRQRQIAKQAGPEIVDQMARKYDQFGDKLGTNRAEALGMPITAAEAMGAIPSGRLAAIGRLSGETGDELTERMWERIHGTPEGIVNDARIVTGVDPDLVAGNLDKAAASMRAKAAPLYTEWHGQRGVDSEELAAIRDTAQFKDAIPHAAKLISADRESPYEILGASSGEVPLLIKNEKGEIVPVMSGGRPVTQPKETALKLAEQHGFTYPKEILDQEERRLPTPKAYDYVKQGFDQLLNQYRDKATGRLDLSSPDARAIMKVRGELGAELTNPQQPWGKAAAAAFKAGGDPIRMEEAFYDDARKALNLSSAPHQFDGLMERYFGKKATMGESDVEALRGGVVQEIADAARKGNIRRLKTLLKPEMTRRLETIFGKEKAAALTERLRYRTELLESAQKMLPKGGSRTAFDEAQMREQQAEGQLAKRMVTHMILNPSLKRTLTSAIHYAIEGAWDRAQVGQDEATRDVTGALLMKSPSEFLAAMEKHGANKAEAAKALDLVQEMGWFTPRAAAAVGGAQHSEEPSDALEP